MSAGCGGRTATRPADRHRDEGRCIASRRLLVAAAEVVADSFVGTQEATVSRSRLLMKKHRPVVRAISETVW
jgi:hypothetical protein